MFLFPAMLRWRKVEFVWLKGMEIRGTPKGGSSYRIEPTLFIWKIIELAGGKRVEISGHPLRTGACVKQSSLSKPYVDFRVRLQKNDEKK